MKSCVRLAAVLLVILSVSVQPFAFADGVLANVSFKLDAKPYFDDPLSRWLEELSDMAIVTVGFCREDGGKYLEASLKMGSQKAFDVKIARVSGNVYVGGSLLDQPVKIEGVCDWADDMLFQAAYAVKTPSTGSLTPVSAGDLALALGNFATSVRAISAVARGSVSRECENCGNCRNCETCDIVLSLAMFVEALAFRFDTLPETNALLIRCETEKDAFPPFALDDAQPVSDATTVNLIRNALTAVFSATMANA